MKSARRDKAAAAAEAAAEAAAAAVVAAEVAHVVAAEAAAAAEVAAAAAAADTEDARPERSTKRSAPHAAYRRPCLSSRPKIDLYIAATAIGQCEVECLIR